jgi:DNA-binding transcriptional regulator YiaG
MTSVKSADYAAIRKRWGLTQEQMAMLMEVSGKLVISHYERGFRSPSAVIRKLYRLLDELPEHEARTLMRWLEEFCDPAEDGNRGKRRKKD